MRHLCSIYKHLNDKMDLKFNHIELSDVGKIRQNNEDYFAFATIGNGCLFLVCDGMGGLDAGEEASQIACESITEFFLNKKYENILQAINESIEQANSKIRTYATQNNIKKIGATLTMLLFEEDHAYIAHAGDSRIYLLTEKKLHQITKDHSYIQFLIDTQNIPIEEAKKHPKKNMITKALGTQETVNAKIQKQKLLPAFGDIFLMCSDGLYNMVDNEKLENILNSKADLKQKAEILIKTALDNGGIDNITLALIEITESSHLKSIFVDPFK